MVWLENDVIYYIRYDRNVKSDSQAGVFSISKGNTGNIYGVTLIISYVSFGIEK
jgi:hypothetical protein